MKNLTLVLAALLTLGTAHASQGSKDSLISVHQKFLDHQNECRSMETNLANDTFLVNLDADIQEGVQAGNISKDAGDRVVKMINTFINLSHGLCAQVDQAVEMIDKSIKNDAAPAFLVSEFEKEIQAVSQKSIEEMLSYAVAPHLVEKEQEMLMIIGQVMKRAVSGLLPQEEN